jgi:hypothetical protein
LVAVCLYSQSMTLECHGHTLSVRTHGIQEAKPYRQHHKACSPPATPPTTSCSVHNTYRCRKETFENLEIGGAHTLPSQVSWEDEIWEKSNAITEDHFVAKVTERYQTHSLLAILLLHLLPCSHSRRGGMCV